MKFMIACHGRLASGVKSTLKLFIGEEDLNAIETIDAYVDDTDYTPQLQAFIDGVADDDFGIIFTDFAFGSVNQKVLVLNQKPNIINVTGFNPSLLMEIILSKPTNIEDIEMAIEGARQEMKISKLEIFEETGNEDFF